jgi:hypothetical protein
MIEVFKTDVKHRHQANMLLDQIHSAFADYKANFDLDDCDNILRVKSNEPSIQSECLINILKDFGFHAEVLPDDCQFGHSLLPEGIKYSKTNEEMIGRF